MSPGSFTRHSEVVFLHKQRPNRVIGKEQPRLLVKTHLPVSAHWTEDTPHDIIGTLGNNKTTSVNQLHVSVTKLIAG